MNARNLELLRARTDWTNVVEDPERFDVDPDPMYYHLNIYLV